MYDTYSPYQDDEEQRALAALAAAGEPPPPMAAAVAQAEPPPAAPAPVPYHGTPDVARAAMVASDPGTPPPSAAAPQDDGGGGPNGWAIAADLVFNRGRDLGKIISAAENQPNKKLEAEYKRAQIAHLNSAGGANNAQALALREQALELSKSRLAQQGSQFNQRIDTAAHKAEQADKDAAAVRDVLAAHGVDVSHMDSASLAAFKPLMSQFNQDAKLANAPAINQAAADKQTAVTGARLDEEHAKNPQTVGDRAAIAEAESGARLPAQTALKQTPSAGEQRAIANEDLAHSPMPGITIADKAAWDAATINPAERQKIDKYVQGGQVSLSALDKMIELRQKYGHSWGALDEQQKRVAVDQMANLQKQAIGGAALLGNSGVLNGQEFPRYAKDLPDGSLGGRDVVDEAIGGLTGTTPRDTQLEQLMGAREAFKNAINAGLKHAGASYGETSQPQAPSSPPAAAEPKVSATPVVSNDQGPSALPVEVGREGRNRTNMPKPKDVIHAEDVLGKDEEWKKRFERYRVSP
jgi:hypothetical protein